mgnify:FL=1
MIQRSNPVVFFGSGPVAAKSLELLLAHQDVEAVITKPSTFEAMRQIVSSDCSVYTATNKAELDELIASASLTSIAGVLVDFGIIVSQNVIDYFSRGIINSHFSLLPKWRGADPISFAILSGDKETGVSLMQLTAGMDEGPVIAQGPLTIRTDHTNETLTQELIELSDELMQNFLPEYLAGSLTTISQTEAANLLGIDPKPTYSRKLTKEDGLIDWTKPAVRAFHSWPKSYTKLNGTDLIIREVRVRQKSGPPGTYIFDKKSLVIYCGQDALEIISLQPSGKKEMPVHAFLAGYKL